jgi:hypothetical protein
MQQLTDEQGKKQQNLEHVFYVLLTYLWVKIFIIRKLGRSLFALRIAAGAANKHFSSQTMFLCFKIR